MKTINRTGLVAALVTATALSTARPAHADHGLVAVGALAAGVVIGTALQGASQPTVVYAPAPVAYAPAPVVYAPAPVVYAPAPVVYAPAPVVYAPAPVVYAPAPVVYAPARVGVGVGVSIGFGNPYYAHPHYHGRWRPSWRCR